MIKSLLLSTICGSRNHSPVKVIVLEYISGDVSGNSFESSGSGHHQNIANCVGRKPKILSPKDSKNSSFSSEADSSASTAVTRQHHQTAANVRRKLSSGDDGSPAVTLPSRKGPSSANQVCSLS